MNRRHVPFLDHFRGVAILLVVIFHSLVPAFNRHHLKWDGWFRLGDPEVEGGYLPLGLASYGWCGVAIFFVVSGFCIHLSYLGSPGWKDFAIRRFFRIYPPYFAALIFAIVVFPMRHLDFSTFGGRMQFLTHATLLHNLHPESLYGIVGSFWSIGVEVQLYFLYAVLLVPLSRRWGWSRTLGSAAAVEVALRIAGTVLIETDADMPKVVIGVPFTYLFSWAIGVVLAEAHFHQRQLPFTKLSIPLLLFLAFGSETFLPLRNFSFLFFALLTAATIAKLLSGAVFPIKVPGFLSEHLRRAGIWSYSIYLLHQPLVEQVPWALAKLFPTTSFSPLATFAICASSWFLILPLAGVWYWAFERTSIQLSKRFTKSRKVA